MYRSGCEGQDTGLYTNLLIVSIVTHVYSVTFSLSSARNASVGLLSEEFAMVLEESRF